MTKSPSRINKKRDRNRKRVAILLSVLMFVSVVGIYKNEIYTISKTTFFTSISNLGFIVSDIYVTEIGRHPVKSRIGEIGLGKGDVILGKSTSELYQAVFRDPWVKDVFVHKGLPNKISIKVVYKEAMAVYQRDSKFALIDTDGDFIEFIKEGRKKWKLPLVTGENAEKKVKGVLDIIEDYPIIKKKLKALSYIRERRWDIILSNGITVKLPEEGIKESLNALDIILKDQNLNRNSVRVMDMRVKDKVIFSGTKLIESDGKKSIKV